MNDIAIRVENLGKLYRIGASPEQYKTLRDSIMNAISSTYRHFRNPASIETKNGTFWALRNLSFEVKEGEIVGIIGRNGAGKSTLLKILSGITEPTEGRVEIHGRVGSLLEVGTGFHQELTGRENIYLSGAILGMKRVEIDRKFDEIVAFAEIEKFLDTPVKRYSSGMYVRLAFAVAAHLEPEILLVDEVLAVGDAEFQKKCLGKMGNVAKEGRTVLFISHNMAAIEHLCERALVLAFGKLLIDANVDKAIQEYLGGFFIGSENFDLALVKRDHNFIHVLRRIEFLDRNGRSVTSVSVGAPLTIKIHYKHYEALKDPTFGIVFETATGIRVFFVQTHLQKGSLPILAPKGIVACHIHRIPLVPGTYYLTLGCKSGTTQLDLVTRGCQLTVSEADIFGTGRVPPPDFGMVVVEADWEVLAEM